MCDTTGSGIHIARAWHALLRCGTFSDPYGDPEAARARLGVTPRDLSQNFPIVDSSIVDS